MENQATLFYQQGVQSLHSEDYLEAAALFRQALAFKPHDTDTLLNLGYTLSRIGRFSEAAAMYSTLLCYDPNNIEALRNHGLCLASIGNTDEGLNELRKAMSLAPTNQGVYLALGHVHRDLQQYSDALAMYDRALALDQRSEVYLSQAVVYRKTGAYDKAVRALEAAQSLDPHNIYIDLEFGHVASANQNSSEALHHYQRAMDSAPSNLDAIQSYGLLCLKIGKNQEAASAFRRVIVAQPQHIKALYNLGVAEKRLRHYSAAITALEEVIRIAPHCLEPYQVLRDVQLKTLKWRAALLTVRKAFKNVRG